MENYPVFFTCPRDVTFPRVQAETLCHAVAQKHWVPALSVTHLQALKTFYYFSFLYWAMGSHMTGKSRALEHFTGQSSAFFVLFLPESFSLIMAANLDLAFWNRQDLSRDQRHFLAVTNGSGTFQRSQEMKKYEKTDSESGQCHIFGFSLSPPQLNNNVPINWS